VIADIVYRTVTHVCAFVIITLCFIACLLVQVWYLDCFFVVYLLECENNMTGDFLICVKETDPDFDLCAICVEGYKAGDVLRVLPCKYVTC